MIPSVLLAGLAAWHPLHASSATVTFDRGGAGRVTIRAFADDMPEAVDSVHASAYLATRFLMTGADGRRIPLVLTRVRTDRDAVVFDLRAATPARCEGARVWNGVLMERFADQVNLVQAQCGTRRRHLVFSAGEGSKPL